ncbi:MAG: DUF4139 domain-containing protein [Flavobacteriales bacterium]|nr:DUF4139 domain-containing protein [Flavobacteriales bacterium]
MKNVLLAAFAVLFSLNQTIAQDIVKIIDSRITNVTVFMQGAQVTRSGKVSLPKGQSYVVFDEVSPSTNQESLKASGKGSFTILDISYRVFYPEPEAINQKEQNATQQKINKVLDSIKIHNLNMANNSEKINAVQTEKNLLLGHPLLRGGGKPDSLDLLKGTLEYLEGKLKTLADRLLELKLIENKMLEESNRLSQRHQELVNFQQNGQWPMQKAPKYQIVVSVMAEAATSAELEVNYSVFSAGWSPWYDISAKDAGNDIELIYKAAVYQNSGEDWSGVRLRVSNANPNQSNVKPVLPVWYINYYQHIQRTVANKDKALRKEAYYYNTTEAKADMAEMDDEKAPAATMAYDYSQKMQNFSSVEFDISLPYNIKSNGKVHYVTVQRHVLKAEFKHFLVPKLDNDAFVVARILDWENLDLLVGNANIYFGNTFIGRTVIDPTVVMDTLEVSMGRYRSMAVKRTKLDEENKNKIIGSNKVYSATYQIEVRNNSGNPIDLVLEDQIPTTTNQNIKIELVNADGGELNAQTGLITWRMKLAPQKKQIVKYKYTIEYPKEQTLGGL